MPSLQLQARAAERARWCVAGTVPAHVDRMESVVGIVDTESRARQDAADVLRDVPNARIKTLTREDRPRDLDTVPADDSEQPGMGSAIGAVTGGATGAALASLLVSPVGAIAVAGIAAGALLGIVG